jgi:hypothetical protein
MCINSQTSLAAFIIGELSGLLLLKSNNKEKKIIGLFVMFYSLVQLMEYFVYKNINVKISSQLLLTILGLQGIVLFLLVNTICKINNMYTFLSFIIFIYILYHVFLKNYKSATVEKCIKWNFMSIDIRILLHVMYFLIFHLLFFNKCIYNNIFLRNSGYFFLLTFMASFIISKTNINAPSFWCMSSAILAPILLIL